MDDNPSSRTAATSLEDVPTVTTKSSSLIRPSSSVQQMSSRVYPNDQSPRIMATKRRPRPASGDSLVAGSDSQLHDVTPLSQHRSSQVTSAEHSSSKRSRGRSRTNSKPPHERIPSSKFTTTTTTTTAGDDNSDDQIVTINSPLDRYPSSKTTTATSRHVSQRASSSSRFPDHVTADMLHDLDPQMIQDALKQIDLGNHADVSALIAASEDLLAQPAPKLPQPKPIHDTKALAHTIAQEVFEASTLAAHEVMRHLESSSNFSQSQFSSTLIPPGPPPDVLLRPSQTQQQLPQLQQQSQQSQQQQQQLQQQQLPQLQHQPQQQQSQQQQQPPQQPQYQPHYQPHYQQPQQQQLNSPQPQPIQFASHSEQLHFLQSPQHRYAPHSPQSQFSSSQQSPSHGLRDSDERPSKLALAAPVSLGVSPALQTTRLGNRYDYNPPSALLSSSARLSALKPLDASTISASNGILAPQTTKSSPFTSKNNHTITGRERASAVASTAITKDNNASISRFIHASSNNVSTNNTTGQPNVGAAGRTTRAAAAALAKQSDAPPAAPAALASAAPPTVLSPTGRKNYNTGALQYPECKGTYLNGMYVSLLIERVKSILVRDNLKQKDLAHYIGISGSTLSPLLKHKYQHTKEQHLHALADWVILQDKLWIASITSRLRVLRLDMPYELKIDIVAWNRYLQLQAAYPTGVIVPANPTPAQLATQLDRSELDQRVSEILQQSAANRIGEGHDDDMEQEDEDDDDLHFSSGSNNAAKTKLATVTCAFETTTKPTDPPMMAVLLDVDIHSKDIRGYDADGFMVAGPSDGTGLTDGAGLVVSLPPVDHDPLLRKKRQLVASTFPSISRNVLRSVVRLIGDLTIRGDEEDAAYVHEQQQLEVNLTEQPPSTSSRTQTDTPTRRGRSRSHSRGA